MVWTLWTHMWISINFDNDNVRFFSYSVRILIVFLESNFVRFSIEILNFGQYPFLVVTIAEASCELRKLLYYLPVHVIQFLSPLFRERHHNNNINNKRSTSIPYSCVTITLPSSCHEEATPIKSHNLGKFGKIKTEGPKQ